MIDNYNRIIDYIRISVTDRCNQRCIYCMPREGITLMPHEEIVTYDEIIRLCKCFVKIGINKIKITGGEPLVRKDIAALIGRIKSLDGIKSVTLTTNGMKLMEQLPNLVSAGLDGINISLDSLNPITYEKITGRNSLQNVLAALNETLKYQELRVKINCVPTPETEAEDIISIAGLGKNTRINVRFIEMMPIGLGKNFSGIGEANIKSILQEAYGQFEVFEKVLGNGPAHYYSLPGFKGKIGFISALTHQFCQECNRVRLTSNGFLKTCLQYETGADLKTILRGNYDDSYLEQRIRQTIYDKPLSHKFNEKNQNESYEKSNMSRIGG